MSFSNVLSEQKEKNYEEKHFFPFLSHTTQLPSLAFLCVLICCTPTTLLFKLSPWFQNLAVTATQPPMLGFRTLLCIFLVWWSSYCWSQPSILYRAWLEPELIFFTAAHKVLCVRFVTRTVLIVHWCFRYCWKVLTQCQGLLCWEAIRPGELTWIDQSNPYHVTSCSAIKLGGKFFRRSCCLETGWAAVCLWEVVSDCLSFTSRGRACFVPVFCFCFFFFFLLHLLTCQPKSLSDFWPSDCPPHSLARGESKWLRYQPVSTHRTHSIHYWFWNRFRCAQIKMKLLFLCSPASATFLSKRKQKS